LFNPPGRSIIAATTAPACRWPSGVDTATIPANGSLVDIAGIARQRLDRIGLKARVNSLPHPPNPKEKPAGFGATGLRPAPAG